MREEQTYSPRDKPLRSAQSHYEEPDEVIKPITLPDPKFIPKPILKRREPEIIEVAPEEKSKKHEKSIFKKFTKMPVQKPFSFPRLLHRKEEDKIVEKSSPPVTSPPTEPPPQAEKDDEGKTVIDYYGSILKEFGGNKKAQTTLYLNTEDLKHVAEQQEGLDAPSQRNKRTTETSNGKPNHANAKTKVAQSISKQTHKKRPTSSKEKMPNAVKQNSDHEKSRQQVVLTTERATVVIPIDYAELEQQAAITVRSAINYVVDCCLLLLAFWLFLFEDERLAIPLLVLIIYRQLNTAIRRVPRWIAAHTPHIIRPAWLT